MSWDLYFYIATGWIVIGVITFFYLLKQTAPYGRHTTAQWGPLIDNKLGWFLMEFFVLVVLYCFLLTGGVSINLTSAIMIGLFTFHYLNRSILFPLRIKTKGKKMPLVIMLSAMGFNMMNGFLLGYYFGNFAHYTVDWLTDPRFIIGSLIFVVGLVINWHSDGILINLRKPGETGYKIPNGGLFTWVSCPNLLGEIIEWLGFAILTWSLPGLVFVIWTFANVAPRAVSHHAWYQTRFSEYPKKRKAIFPYVW
jgi:3-oxo-5-alpha-steroid 4-dehydrogenase 1